MHPARRCTVSWASADALTSPHPAQSYSHWLQKGQTEGPQGWPGNCTEPRIFWLDFEDSSAAPPASGRAPHATGAPGYPAAAGVPMPGGPIARPAAAPKAETAPPVPMPGYPGGPIARPAAAPKAETTPPVPQSAFGEEHQDATFGGGGATFGDSSATFGGGTTFGSSDLFEKK